jgi:thioredoxin reductase (NADPH)
VINAQASSRFRKAGQGTSTAYNCFGTMNAQHQPTDEVVDCLIVGAGPAGLAAATYLGRFKRSVLVAHTGDSRAMLIPRTHNCPGFPEGISGRELLERLTRQARNYDARIVECGISRIERAGLPDGSQGFLAYDGGGRFQARTVMLATGVVDRKPDVPGMEQAIVDGIVRLCPICDGYEVEGRRIAVIGSDAHALREAQFLRRFTPDMTLLAQVPSAGLRSDAAASRIKLLETTGEMVREGNGYRFALAGGETAHFEIVYPALGVDVRSRLAEAIGARRDSDGYILVDAHQQTSQEGVYAIGDAVKALNQIAVGFGQAAIAATAIHNALRTREDPAEYVTEHSSREHV